MAEISQPLSFLRAGFIAPHRHLRPYAAIVQSGRYAQSDGDSLFEMRASRVAFHGPMSFHANTIHGAGVHVRNVPLTIDVDWPSGVLESEIEAPADPRELLCWCAQARPVAPSPAPHWLDVFASLVRTMPVARAARFVGVSREHAARAFRAYFLMSPTAARHGARLQQLAASMLGDEPLGACAAAAGYADQPHMTRSVRDLTGMSPAQLRRSLRKR